MARTIADAELTRLTDAPKYAIHLKVKIADATGILRSYAAQAGTDWVISAVLEQDIDQPIAQATVHLWREIWTETGEASLSPLRDDSELNTEDGPAIDVGRRILIETATTELGARPRRVDWRTMFDGFIDVIRFAATPIEIVARDLAGAFQDEIFTVALTAVNDATSVQDMMTHVLGILYLDTLPEVYVPEAPDPEVAVTSIGIGLGESGMDVLLRLAQVNGWDLRVRYDDVTGLMRFTFRDPVRDKTEPDFTLGPAQYINVTQLDLDATQVRNTVVVNYGAAGDRGQVVVLNPTSIARYRRRTLVINEADSSEINTLEEASRMADAILADVSDPKATHAIELFYFWPIEVNDLLRLQANGVHYDSDQDAAVVSIRHELGPEKSRTTITVRDKPMSSWWGWLRRYSFPGDGTLDGETTPPFGFSNLAQAPDYDADTILLFFLYSDPPDATAAVFQCWTRRNGVGAFEHVVTDIGAGDPQEFTFDPEADLVAADDGGGTMQVEFYVVAVDGSSTVIATSRTSSALYFLALEE